MRRDHLGIAKAPVDHGMEVAAGRQPDDLAQDIDRLRRAARDHQYRAIWRQSGPQDYQPKGMCLEKDLGEALSDVWVKPD
jgi:hypothetical protein